MGRVPLPPRPRRPEPLGRVEFPVYGSTYTALQSAAEEALDALIAGAAELDYEYTLDVEPEILRQGTATPVAWRALVSAVVTVAQP
jgi:hypothetical protein